MRNLFTLFFLSVILLPIHSQSPVLTTSVVPQMYEQYTYRAIIRAGDIDTTLTGENYLWDFNKVKDTAHYYIEVFRKAPRSYYSEFDEIYSIDSNDITNDLMIWVNALDSFGYYHLGAYEKDIAPFHDVPYLYEDSMIVLKFPFGYGDQFNDTYDYIKGGRKHYKGQYTSVNVLCDGYGTLVLPNNDSVYNALRLRREEIVWHQVDNKPVEIGRKLTFYWYGANVRNYMLKLIYINGVCKEAWYLKKKKLLKKPKNEED